MDDDADRGRDEDLVADHARRAFIWRPVRTMKAAEQRRRFDAR